MARSYAFGVTLISSRSWPNWASANSLDSSCLLRASSLADLRRERSQVLDRGYANFYEKALFVKVDLATTLWRKQLLCALRAMLLFALSGSSLGSSVHRMRSVLIRAL